MNTTKAEYLPNELWFQIFSYLENADILYGFNLLNIRFQQIITPYFHDIDLSEVSLKQFNTLMKDILLSEQDHNICSLTLKNSGQFKRLFYPKEHYKNKNSTEVPGKNIRHIQTLKLTIDHWSHAYDLLSITLPRLPCMSNLNDLHLNMLPISDRDESFADFVKYFPLTITKLTMFGMWKHTIPPCWELGPLQIPSNIKSLAFSIENLQTIYKLHFLRKPNNHIEELKIYFSIFDRFEDKYANLQFSTSLIALHLELPSINMEVLSKFLRQFTNQLKSLILIIRTNINTSSDLKNELNNMIKDIFPCLETFKYTIYSTNSNRAPLPFSKILKTDFNEGCLSHDYCLSHSFKSLLHETTLYFDGQKNFSDINLIKLRKLTYSLSQPSNLNLKEINLLNNLLLTSPNLKCLQVLGDNSYTLIGLLELISTKNITKLQCNISEFHYLFLIDLAQIIPHLRELCLTRVHFNEYSIVYRERKRIYRKLLAAKVAIEHVQLYHKELIHLYLHMPSFDDTDYRTCIEHEQLESWLLDKRQQKKFYSIYKLYRDPYDDYPWSDDDDHHDRSIIYSYCLYVSP